jgi:hypothetical protein
LGGGNPKSQIPSSKQIPISKNQNIWLPNLKTETPEATALCAVDSGSGD